MIVLFDCPFLAQFELFAACNLPYGQTYMKYLDDPRILPLDRNSCTCIAKVLSTPFVGSPQAMSHGTSDGH